MNQHDFTEALGHDIETVTVDATCGKDGSITKTCTCCNHEEVIAIAATGKHTYGDWTVTVNPTASKVGEKELAPGGWLISEVHLEYQGGWKYMWANSWNGTQWNLSFSGMNSETWETYLHGLTIVNTNIFDKNDWLDIGSYDSYTISNGILTLNYN